MNTFIVFTALYFMVVSVQGHGYLLDPPARGSAWRKGFKTPTDYNDMANFCGGKQVQHGSKNNGRCGVCGEEYSLEAKKLEPGPGNIFATGTIVGNYKQGETIDITIQTTAYHKGYYEFRLCENNVPQVGKDSSIAVTSECLNRNLLTSAQSGSTRFTASQGKSTHQVVLPESVSCSACVLQWRYKTGNSWGCENGECGNGLGPQEEFIGCADIAIEPVKAVKASTSKPVVTSEAKTTSAPVTERRPTTQPVYETPPPDTTEKPAPTTEKPAPTTEKPAPTTEKPAPTTQKPAPTTEKPAPTTEKPAPTTEKPAPTTQKPAPTTLKPAPTTEKPAPTTEKPAPTTEKPAPTTEKPAPTTEKPAPTTQKPAPTTEKPAPTTQKPAPTTQKPAPTTQKPAPTTEKPVKISTTQKVLKVPTTQQIVKTNPPKEVTVAVVQPPAQNKDCVGRAPWGANMTIYCRQNCLRKINPYCPPSHCTCRLI